MDIRIQRDASVSLHDQIVRQISMQIASGLLKPGSKLPSIRALSYKLGIHHNTCLAAYRSLEKIDLIEIRHGSGMRVKLLDADQQAILPKSTDLKALTDFFVQQIKQRGYSWHDALSALHEAYKKQAQPLGQLVFVDLNADILPVFQAELEYLLGQPVRTMALDALKPEREQFSHFIVSRYHYPALKERLKPFVKDKTELTKKITLIDIGSGKQEMDLLRRLPAGSLICIVSVSTTILSQAEAVIHALFGDDILVQLVLYGSEPVSTLKPIIRRAKVIYSDYFCIKLLSEMSKKTIQPIQTIPEHASEKLKNLFSSESSLFEN